MSRVSQHKEKEAKRLEAEREKIRAEEQAKAKREADALILEAAQAADAKRITDEKASAEQTTAANQTQFEQPAAVADEKPQPVLGARIALPADACLPKIKLGEICTRLGFTVSAEFLASLGFEATTEKNAKLYNEASFPAICRRISDHTLRVGMTTKKAA